LAVIALLLAGALSGPALAVDGRPVNASRSDAIREAAREQSPSAPSAAVAPARYPSIDGDILAGISAGIRVSPLAPYRPVAAAPRSPSATSAGVDASGLLGGPRH
jgi:hypothetical protein